MKTFISAADIEALAEQGVREMTVDEDTVLTAVARETAAQLGVKLVSPGTATRGAVTSVAGAPALSQAVTGGKPKGCQHGPISGGATPAASAANANTRPPTIGDPKVVDELIGAVKQMARK